MKGKRRHDDDDDDLRNKIRRLEQKLKQKTRRRIRIYDSSDSDSSDENKSVSSGTQPRASHRAALHQRSHQSASPTPRRLHQTFQEPARPTSPQPGPSSAPDQYVPAEPAPSSIEDIELGDDILNLLGEAPKLDVPLGKDDESQQVGYGAASSSTCSAARAGARRRRPVQPAQHALPGEGARALAEPAAAAQVHEEALGHEDEPASSGDSGDESGSDPESPSDKLHQTAFKQEWGCNSSTERDGGSREPQASTSSTTQEADSSKASHPSMPKLLPKIDLPGGAMLYPGVLAGVGLDGLGSNLGLGNLAMGYPHSFILGLANQGQEGASSSSQPQFITIPLSMAMGNPQAPNGCPSASSDDSSELQDLSTGGRK